MKMENKKKARPGSVDRSAFSCLGGIWESVERIGGKKKKKMLM